MKGSAEMSIDILKNISTVNTTAKNNRTIKYIVLHYTAGTSSNAGSARSIANYFKGGNAGGSADFIVDDETIVQYNSDIKNRYCWAVGGNKYASMATSEGGKFYNKCTNANSISIEMCSNKTGRLTLYASDEDWYFTEATVENAAKLTKYLMELYDISIDNVIMHHHVTGKICPNPWCVNEARLTQWNDFKTRLIEVESEEDDEMVETGTITVNSKDIKIDKIVKDGTTYIKLRGLENAGFEVGYNAGSKNLTLENTVNDISVEIDGKGTVIKGINVGGYNYCKLRDVTDALGNLEIDYQNNVVIIKNVLKGN